MEVQTKKLTYEEFLKLPEIKRRYEVIDGEIIYIVPGPTPKHQSVSMNFVLPLHSFIKIHDLGELFFAPLDVLVQRSPLRTRQPDILFISKERSAIIGENMIEGGPDLVIEILSPTNTRRHVDEKLKDYWSLGVRECWLVSPEGHTIEVLKSGQKGFQRSGLYGVGDEVVSEVLPGFRMKVEEIW